ncbi:hypothetical protein X777_05863 [Ooceraea biroi]|uniref:Uncharacterized protein n=1 Tax=Ooceraea biroi TaxID=2015173 RepID=A0A026WG48_OOCBI|nr:hypothetical protein X777_05863 [Ooceraea biroi]
MPERGVESERASEKKSVVCGLAPPEKSTLVLSNTYFSMTTPLKLDSMRSAK